MSRYSVPIAASSVIKGDIEELDDGAKFAYRATRLDERRGLLENDSISEWLGK